MCQRRPCGLNRTTRSMAEQSIPTIRGELRAEAVEGKERWLGPLVLWYVDFIFQLFYTEILSGGTWIRYEYFQFCFSSATFWFWNNYYFRHRRQYPNPIICRGNIRNEAHSKWGNWYFVEFIVKFSDMVPLDGHIPVKRNFQGEMLRIGPMCRYAEDLPLLLKVQFTFWIKNYKKKILTFDDNISRFYFGNWFFTVFRMKSRSPVLAMKHRLMASFRFWLVRMRANLTWTSRLFVRNCVCFMPKDCRTAQSLNHSAMKWDM